MAAIYEQYTEEIHREFGYSATWLPNTPVSVGDVGYFHRDRFQRATSLREMGVNIEVSPLGEPGDLEYLSANQVQVSWRTDAAGGPAAPVAEASAVISVVFRRAHAVVFQALGSRVRTIRDQPALAAKLLPLVDSGRWQPDYAVITEVVQTGPSAVLVSSQANARADFRVRAGTLTGPCALAQAGANLGVMSTSGLSVKILAPKGLTPLFRACAFRSRFRKPPRLTYRGGIEELPEGASVARGLDFGPLGYEDALPPMTV
jgi:hypothetical protein